MGRPGLRVGEWGHISAREVSPGVWRARCRVRDFDGVVRDVARFAKSRNAAVSSLKRALSDRIVLAGGGGEVTRDSRITELGAAWLLEVDSADLAKSTKARYATIVNTFIRDGLGQLRLYELTVPAVDRFLRAVRANHGAATAKGCRTVLSGMVGLALRHGAITSNPVAHASPIRGGERKPVRALTREEQAELLNRIAADPRAIEYDLVDLCRFMAGTGCRIGEACGLREPYIDLAANTVEIAASVTDFGLEERTKTAAGWRVIAVPPAVATMLEERMANPALATHVVLFPSPLGRVRDTSNTAADLRRAFDAAGFPWVTSHTFRRTVATRLDEAGLSARQIADHLGHARPSMTQDVYMGRNVASSRAAEVLAA